MILKLEQRYDRIFLVIVMDVKRLIDILDVKEEQALAFCSIYKDTLEYEDLQNAIDNYCANMVESFMENYKKELQNDTVVLQLRRHIHSIGADKEHSGKRVYETLYKRINKTVKR